MLPPEFATTPLDCDGNVKVLPPVVTAGDAPNMLLPVSPPQKMPPPELGTAPKTPLLELPNKTEIFSLTHTAAPETPPPICPPPQMLSAMVPVVFGEAPKMLSPVCHLPNRLASPKVLLDPANVSPLVLMPGPSMRLLVPLEPK